MVHGICIMGAHRKRKFPGPAPDRRPDTLGRGPSDPVVSEPPRPL